ncbi:MAG: hypothetical protein F4X02_13485 [Chloroflexi bacterium]|nr:hypothetical protein [Chloroflexota bacterium]
MFRGFRWQLATLLFALLACAAAAVFRVSRLPTPPATATAPPQTIAPVASESPTPMPSTLPAADARLPSPSATSAPFSEGLIGNVRRINPLFAHLNTPDRDLAGLIFEGLFAINDYGEVVPRLAAELVISSDGLEYVVRLRDNIKWQDGVPFSADDVVYTLSLLSAADYAEYSDTAAFWRTVETQRLSADLVRFRLAQPFSSFPLLLTIGLLPEHALRGTTVRALASHPFNLSPIGTGPYQLAALRADADGRIFAARLQRSPTHRERPEAQTGYQFRDLIFRFYASESAAIAAYESLAIDAIALEDPPAPLLSLPQSRHFRQALPQLGVLIFNWKDTPFGERRARQALALSLDLPGLAQRHFGAAAVHADSPYILGSSVYQPNFFWHTFDVDEARTLLASAELAPAPDDADGPDLYRLLVENSARLRGLAEDIAGNWRPLGFDFEVVAVDAFTLGRRLESGDFDAAIISQNIGADRDLFRFWRPDQPGNFGAASHNEIAELIEIARAEVYGGRRALIHRRIQEAFAEQALAIPLYYPLFTYVVRDRIEGVKLGSLSTPADRFRGLQHWRPVALTG